MVKQSTNTHRCCAKVKAARINWRTAWKQQLGLPFQLRKLRNKIKVIVRGSIFSALFDFRSMLARAKWYSYSMIIYRQSSRAIGTKKVQNSTSKEKIRQKTTREKTKPQNLYVIGTSTWEWIPQIVEMIIITHIQIAHSIWVMNLAVYVGFICLSFFIQIKYISFLLVASSKWYISDNNAVALKRCKTVLCESPSKLKQWIHRSLFAR